MWWFDGSNSNSYFKTGAQILPYSLGGHCDWFWCDCSLRLQSHQNLLAADLWIPPMLFNEKVADFLRNPQMADSWGYPLHSHWNALAESTNPQPAGFGVTVALGYSHTKIMLAADLRILPMHFNENAADFLWNPPFADSTKNLLHSHWKALAESTNPQPAGFGVIVPLQCYLSKSKKVLAFKLT